MTKPTNLAEACDRIAALESDLQVAFGRINALLEITSVLILEREGSTEDVVSALAYSRAQTDERNNADPGPETMLTAYFQLNNHAQDLARSVVEQRGKVRWQNGQPASSEG